MRRCAQNLGSIKEGQCPIIGSSLTNLQSTITKKGKANLIKCQTTVHKVRRCATHKAFVPITQVQGHNYKSYVFFPTDGVFTKLRKAEVNLMKYHRKDN